MQLHDNDSSWGALAVAILFECPVTPEEAMELYEDGSIVLDGQKYLAGTVVKSCRMDRLRARGCAWWAISELTGIVYADNYLKKHKGLVAEVKRRKKRFNTSINNRRGAKHEKRDMESNAAPFGAA